MKTSIKENLYFPERSYRRGKIDSKMPGDEWTTYWALPMKVKARKGSRLHKMLMTPTKPAKASEREPYGSETSFREFQLHLGYPLGYQGTREMRGVVEFGEEHTVFQDNRDSVEVRNVEYPNKDTAIVEYLHRGKPVRAKVKFWGRE